MLKFSKEKMPLTDLFDVKVQGTPVQLLLWPGEEEWAGKGCRARPDQKVRFFSSLYNSEYKGALLQLWHRLTCLDPPSGFLAHIQRKMVDLFWGSLLWGAVLAREEWGLGLVHLASRRATFRLQFIQKYLTGLDALVWSDVASCIFRRANNLGLDAADFNSF